MDNRVTFQSVPSKKLGHWLASISRARRFIRKRAARSVRPRIVRRSACRTHCRGAAFHHFFKAANMVGRPGSVRHMRHAGPVLFGIELPLVQVRTRAYEWSSVVWPTVLRRRTRPGRGRCWYRGKSDRALVAGTSRPPLNADLAITFRHKKRPGQLPHNLPGSSPPSRIMTATIVSHVHNQRGNWMFRKRLRRSPPISAAPPKPPCASMKSFHRPGIIVQ